LLKPKCCTPEAVLIYGNCREDVFAISKATSFRASTFSRAPWRNGGCGVSGTAAVRVREAEQVSKQSQRVAAAE